MDPVKGSKKPPAKLRSPPDKIFRTRKPLPRNKLPLNCEVGSALAYQAENFRLERGSKEIDYKNATDVVTKEVLEIYEKASIPTIHPIMICGG